MALSAAASDLRSPAKQRLPADRSALPSAHPCHYWRQNSAARRIAFPAWLPAAPALSWPVARLRGPQPAVPVLPADPHPTGSRSQVLSIRSRCHRHPMSLPEPMAVLVASAASVLLL